MALSVLDTVPGRAMLVNAAMRQADLGRILAPSEIFDMMMERWPHWVHYKGRRPVYCPPDTFGFIGRPACNHCDWMVPGSQDF